MRSALLAAALAIFVSLPGEQIGGATIENLNPKLARDLGLPETMSGIVVTDVSPSSPAGAAGLVPGDIIVAVNNTPVHTASELEETIWRMAVSPVMFSVVRNGVGYVFTFAVW
jgi:S1-C subfamily serine protease